jgi:hypothetical protein
MITYRTLEQYDDAGAIYDAFTLEAYDDTNDVTTWYENIVTGWTYGTPDAYTVAAFTVGDVPADTEAWSLEELDDSERGTLHDRARAVLNGPGANAAAAAAAGLEYLGCFDVRHSGRPGVDPCNEYDDALCAFLDSIDYDDVTSF